MKDHFEEELNKVMNEEKEMPKKVRKSIDESYALIQEKSKKKKGKVIWKRTLAAACALIITGVIATNGQVMAGITELFNFGDEGIEQAMQHGFIQENDSVATNQGIDIALDNYFADTHKVGMSFKLAFEDTKVLEGVEDISMDYRLINGDGEYIEEFIPDTKPLKGNRVYIYGHESIVPVLDVEKGIVQFDVVLDSSKGIIPDLKDAIVEVETVNLFNEMGEIDEIDGVWELAVTNGNKGNPESVHYVMQGEPSIIAVQEATANPTSLNIQFSVDGIYENENTFANRMKIIDENGDEYMTNGFHMSTENGETIISTNFPITTYHHSQKLKLMIEGIGEVELVKK